MELASKTESIFCNKRFVDCRVFTTYACVYLSQAGVLSKELNVGLRNQVSAYRREKDPGKCNRLVKEFKQCKSV